MRPAIQWGSASGEPKKRAHPLVSFASRRRNGASFVLVVRSNSITHAHDLFLAVLLSVAEIAEPANIQRLLVVVVMSREALALSARLA